jgi:hypothetical protein
MSYIPKHLRDLLSWTKIDYETFLFTFSLQANDKKSTAGNEFLGALVFFSPESQLVDTQHVCLQYYFFLLMVVVIFFGSIQPTLVINLFE